ncbi:unnamed protein product [Eruca vesicaria subsp. sativa]|uniref:MADS-box domain-containing protein n=1 Tax=Eruca vesicaria subsp. sativa TaxID=29727 RepID=A0ABC8LVN6_ERUVS|nr:unnamed protein product [Eruca vesicaria subsp. sativa]
MTRKKRKKGLLKKVNELSTLCGINACAIIYSPYDTNPEVWPSNFGVQRVISDYRQLPEMETTTAAAAAAPSEATGTLVMEETTTAPAATVQQQMFPVADPENF